MKVVPRAISAVVFLSLAIIVCASPRALAGEWLYKKDDKAFGETEATAMAIGDSSIVFVQCSNGELSINLATPEDWKDDSSQMNLLVPKMIMSTDGAEPVRYDATFGENGMHKLLAKVDDEDLAKEAAEKMVAAKKKLEIGIELGGKKYHASKISMAGATKKIQSVLNECAAKEPVSTKPEDKK